MILRRPITGYLCLAALVGAILLSAAGVIQHRTVDQVFIACAAWTVFNLSLTARTGLPGRALAAGAVVAALGALQAQAPTLQYVPYLAIAPVNLFLAHLFARGLLPGRQPVLLRLIILMGQRPADDRRFRRFVAWQCAIWSVMTFATAVLALAAAVREPARAELTAVLGWLVAAQVIWFVVSHIYAGRRYDRPETCWHTLRAMATPDLWSKLRT